MMIMMIKVVTFDKSMSLDERMDKQQQKGLKTPPYLRRPIPTPQAPKKPRRIVYPSEILNDNEVKTLNTLMGEWVMQSQWINSAEEKISQPPIETPRTRPCPIIKNTMEVNMQHAVGMEYNKKLQKKLDKAEKKLRQLQDFKQRINDGIGNEAEKKELHQCLLKMMNVIKNDMPTNDDDKDKKHK